MHHADTDYILQILHSICNVADVAMLHCQSWQHSFQTAHHSFIANFIDMAVGYKFVINERRPKKMAKLRESAKNIARGGAFGRQMRNPSGPKSITRVS